MKIINLIENTEGKAGCISALPQCHCTGVEAYDIMKKIMGEKVAYVHSGEEVLL